MTVAETPDVYKLVIGFLEQQEHKQCLALTGRIL